MKSFLTAASYGGSAVIVLEDFFIGVTFFCHAVGAVLAHSDSVAGPCGCLLYTSRGKGAGTVYLLRFCAGASFRGKW